MATTEIYTLSLHDALPIYVRRDLVRRDRDVRVLVAGRVLVEADGDDHRIHARTRSEEHTSELQSRQYLVCRLLLEKKKKNIHSIRLIYDLLFNHHLEVLSV